MENFLHILMVWVHILGVALYVGPQFFLAFAWVPASRNIADLPTRNAAMRTITRKFGMIGGIGLTLIFIAGMYLITAWRTYYGVPEDVGFTDVRFGVIFIMKMNILLVMLAVVGVHMFVTGPKLVDAMDAAVNGGAAAEAKVKRLRKQSMILSITGLILVLVIMVMGVMLNATPYSLQDS